MSKETVPVDKDFIIEAHRHASPSQRREIERQVPSLFNKTKVEAGQYRYDDSMDRIYLVLDTIDDFKDETKFEDVAGSRRLCILFNTDKLPITNGYRFSPYYLMSDQDLSTCKLYKTLHDVDV